MPVISAQDKLEKDNVQFNPIIKSLGSQMKNKKMLSKDHFQPLSGWGIYEPIDDMAI